MLTSVVRGSISLWKGLVASRPIAVLRAMAAYLRDPAGTLASADDSRRTRLKEGGSVALAVGVALSFLVPAAFGVPLLRRFLAAGWTAGWALARLFIMRTVSHADSRRRSRSIDDAWGPALAPYALAVVEPLGLVALGVSAWLTWRGLIAVGWTRREASRMTAWAFGGQAAAETAAWIAQGGFVFIMATMS